MHFRLALYILNILKLGPQKVRRRNVFVKFLDRGHWLET